LSLIYLLFKHTSILYNEYAEVHLMKKTNLRSQILKEINKKSSGPRSVNEVVEIVSKNDTKTRKTASTTIRELIFKGDVTVDAGWKLHAKVN